MALYRKGTASLAADGTVTGNDTKWKDQLALIRVGATIIFLDQPIKLAVISDIVSDTELKVIANEGDTAPDGNYVILLHDSLTVNGLAQNVAETLRYYQSKETEIAGAMDTIANLDMDNLNNIVAEVKANRAAAEAARNESDSSAQAAAASASEAGNIKSQIETLIDGSVNTINNAKDKAITEIGSKESSVITHIDTEEAAAIQAINDAKGDLSTYVNDAQTAAQTATAAKNDAQSARDEAVSAKDSAAQSAQEAKDAAASVDAENLLQKNKNLSDVPDKEAARTALDVPAKGEVFLIENNLSEIADRAAAWLNVRPIGATPLGGDAVNDYDAVTLRQVRNMIDGGGGVGPTMNGVQNFGVGTKTLWDSRAVIPAYCVPMDGQLLNRADWPELWSHAQMHSPISDADWLADKFKRVSYSDGDGSTTFRTPDLNGVHEDSLWALYGRGDSGGRYPTNTALENGAPDIVGRIAARNIVDTQASGSPHYLGFGTVSDSGAFYPPYFGKYSGPIGGSQAAPSGTASTNYTAQEFAASRYNKAYGRASDVRPNSFVGVWIVRASGGFTAANTSWSVINSDKEAPPVGTVVGGGDVVSEYNSSGTKYTAKFSVNVGFRQTAPAAAITVSDNVSATSSITYDTAGKLEMASPNNYNSINYKVKGMSWGEVIDSTSNGGKTYNGINSYNDAPANGAVIPGVNIYNARTDGYPTKVGYHLWHGEAQAFANALITIGGDAGNWCRYFLDISGSIYGQNNLGEFSYSKNGVSDRNKKKCIHYNDGKDSYENVKKVKPVEFIYRNDTKGRRRRGIIVQDAQMDIDREWGHEINNVDGGKTIVLDNNAIAMDTLLALKHAIDKIEILENEIKKLKGE